MLVWYAAYGSNLHRDRFLRYLQGGQPDGARRTHAGARDPSDPRAEAPYRLPGRLRFGWDSPTWGGGIAFYEAHGPGEEGEGEGDASEGVVLARAYLLTGEQFADVVAQEMRRAPGQALDLAPALSAGRHAYGPGRYETVHHVGDLDGRPVLTFTADRPGDLPENPPAPAYLRTIAAGLADAHDLAPDAVVTYLRRCSPVAESWTSEELTDLLR
ncbi:histone deacetylase [Serinicoccus kebangsaanensis]|uniref:histone deacetylase n=1 Tax=Serinicoccus kebangsaanensis TaxID=2602069 RepID=UPI00124DBE69|nr:histone deacetylase [Serinicoccus kebangsaanensis]